VTRRWSLVLAALVVAAVAGCTSASGTADGRRGGPPVLTPASPAGLYLGDPLRPPQPRPTFTLTDTAGRRFDFAARTRGRPTFLFFGYTQCPDVCPLTMANVAAALRALPADLVRRVRVVFVTTDPKHDSRPVMASWLHGFDADLPTRFVGLTGSQAQIDAAQAAAKVPLAEDGGRTHSSELLLFGPDDYARVMYLIGGGPDEIMHDLPVVAGG
jgi:protein SCO1